MKVLSKLYDKRIKSLNVLVEMPIKDYYEISKVTLEKNEFQRRRVKSSSTVYSLLKTDLLQGCVIPPIVLALSKISLEENLIKKLNDKEIVDLIKENYNNILILDGLQRTYTIHDLISELGENPSSLSQLEKFNLRIEIYIGINKLGILYRMLTLNTGQTPMSTRHQIEILYSDYLTEDIDGIKLMTEAENTSPSKFGEYKFKDVVEGFNSYLDRDYLTIDRLDILENIKSLEKLSKENQDIDLFKSYIKSYHHLVNYFKNNSNDWTFTSKESLSGAPFGKNIEQVFKKSQVMTGFGSAVGKLIDFGVIDSIENTIILVDKIRSDNFSEALDRLIERLDSIRTIAKKIGNDQRMFFHYLFREIFNTKGDAFLDFDLAIEEAYKLYQMKTQ